MRYNTECSPLPNICGPLPTYVAHYLTYVAYYLTHVAHFQTHAVLYFTQSGQDKQMTQPNLLIIRITLFMYWMHAWGQLPNTCGPLPETSYDMTFTFSISARCKRVYIFVGYTVCGIRVYVVRVSIFADFFLPVPCMIFVAFMSHLRLCRSDLCRNRVYFVRVNVAFGIICRSRPYAVRVNVTFGYTSFGLTSSCSLS